MAGETISWQACVELAAKNNADLGAAEANLRSLEYQEGGARSGFFPQASANLGYSRGNTTSGTSSGSLSESYSANLSATQNLFAGFQDRGKVAQASASARASAAVLQTTRAKVSFDLKSSYEGLLFAKESERLTQDISKRREANLKLVELRFESGRENKGSALLSKAYLQQARYEDLQSRNAESTAQAQLAKILGLDHADGLEIQGEIPAQEPSSPAPDFPRLAAMTPDHAQAVAQEDSAEAAIRVASAGFFPTLNATGTVGKQGPEFFPNNDRWSVGVNFTFPFFSGGKDYYAAKSAVAAWSSSMNNRENVDRQLLARLVQAFNSYVEAVEKLRVDESFRQAALVRSDIARSKYNNGLLSFEDWDIIENDLISRQKTYLQSKRDRVVAEAAWEQAQGKGAIN